MSKRAGIILGAFCGIGMCINAAINLERGNFNLSILSVMTALAAVIITGMWIRHE